jgi:glycosyltransferase involved in cell wall biosynthesis
MATRRILYVDHTAQLSGGEIALYNLVRYIDRGRFEPVVVLMGDGPLVGKLREAGVETHVLPLAGSVVDARKDGLGLGTLLRLGDAAAMLAYVQDLCRFMCRLSIDVVHCNSLKADIIGGLAGKLARKPVVWQVHDRIEADYLPAGVVRLFRQLCRLIPDHVIANSRATLETLRLGRRVPATVVYPGVELDRTDRRAGGPLHRSEEVAIGMIGRISPWKGQHVFIEAAGEVRRRYPEVRFEIIGSAMFAERDYEGEVRRLAEGLGLNGAMEFVGFCDDVPTKLRELSVVVHASTVAEPLGQVVLEAMAAGRPVVATRGGGVTEIVEEGVTGVLVQMGSASELAEALCGILEDPERARLMGVAGQARVGKFFGIEQTAGAVCDIYERVLAASANGCRTLASCPSS